MIIYFFYNLDAFSFSCLTAPARTSSRVLNGMVTADILAPDFGGKTLLLSPLSMMVAVGISDAPYKVRRVSSVPNLSSVL